MKPLKLFFIYFLFFSLSAKIIENNRINSTVLTTFQTFLPIYTPEEQTILTYLNLYNLDNAVAFLNSLGQKYFLRGPHVCRLQHTDVIEYYKNTLFKDYSTEKMNICIKKLYHLFKNADFLLDVFPTHQTPRYILILGSSITSMWSRIEFLNDLVKSKKVKILPETKIILCLGERTLLDTEKEELKRLHDLYSKDVYTSTITDEREGGKLLIQYFPFCPDIQPESIMFALAQKKPGAVRATTPDTIEALLGMISFTKNDTILIVSSNPYIEYQVATTHSILLQKGLNISNSSLEGAGKGSHISEETFDIKDAGIFLDNLARTLYSYKTLYDIVPPSNSPIMKILYDCKIALWQLIERCRKLFI